MQRGRAHKSTLIAYVPNQFKTQEMCGAAVRHQSVLMWPSESIEGLFLSIKFYITISQKYIHKG